MKICYLVVSSICEASATLVRSFGEIGFVARDKKVRVMVILIVPFGELIGWNREVERFKKKASRLGLELFLVPGLPSSRFVAWEVARLGISAILAGVKIFLWGPEIVHAHAVEAGWIGSKLKGILKFRFVFEAHGLAVAEFAEYGVAENRVRLVGGWEKSSVTKANGIVATSESLLKHLVADYKPETVNMAVVPSSVDMKLFTNRNRLTKRRSLKLNDKFVLVYVGALQGWQSFDKVVSVVKALSMTRRDLGLLVISKDPKTARKMLEDVDGVKTVIKNLEHHQVAEHLRVADLGFVLRENNLTNKVASPTKFGEYLACGVPALMTGAVEQMVKTQKTDSSIGLIINLKKADSENEVVKILKFMEDVKKNRDRITSNCRAGANKYYSWQKNIIKIRNLYEKIKEGN